jgi:serine/threonine-protein kinase
MLGQLAYAVHHAHSRGVVHRDLKPGNLIVVGAEETLKVLDFGMAKIVASDHAESVALSTGNLIWGTPKYMSPERIAGAGNDPRIDLYAIGCIGYELLTGMAPFGGTANEIIHAHLTQDALPPSSCALGVPAELDEVILKLLAKKLEDRYQTAAELYAALRKVPGFPQPRAETRRRFVPVDKAPSELRAPDDKRGTLRELAEALLAVGLTDVRLVGGIARLRDHEQSLAALEAALDGLEHEAAAVRETTGEREQSLRFALAELRMAGETGERVQELEMRLKIATDTVERLAALEARIQAMTEMRAKGLDNLKTAYDALERVVGELLPAYREHPAIHPLVDRMAALR